MKYTKEQIEKHKIYNKKSYLKNRDERIKKVKKYYLINREKIRVYKKNNYIKNLDYYKIKYKEWRETTRGIYYCLKSRAKKRNIEFDLKVEEFVEWHKQQKKECHYCKITEQEIKESKNKIFYKFPSLTIDRLDNNTGYVKDNIKLSCFLCNRIKGDFFSEDEMILIGKIINNKYKNICEQ